MFLLKRYVLFSRFFTGRGVVVLLACVLLVLCTYANFFFFFFTLPVLMSVYLVVSSLNSAT